MLPCPGEAGKLSFPQVDLERFPEGASALHLSCFHPEMAGRDGRKLERGVDEGACHARQRQRLEQQDGSEDEQRLVAEAAHEGQHEAYDGIEHEDFACEEDGIDIANQKKKQQTPAEAKAKIFSFFLLTAVHDEEAEAEEDGEDGVSLAAKHEEEAVPDGSIGEVEPCALLGGVRKGVEVEVFDGVKQDDAHHGEAAEHVCYINAGRSRVCHSFLWVIFLWV